MGTSELDIPVKSKAAKEVSRWVTDEAYSGIQGRINAISDSLDQLVTSLYPALEDKPEEEAPGASTDPDRDTRAPILVMLGQVHNQLNLINFRIQGITNRVTL